MRICLEVPCCSQNPLQGPATAKAATVSCSSSCCCNTGQYQLLLQETLSVAENARRLGSSDGGLTSVSPPEVDAAAAGDSSCSSGKGTAAPAAVTTLPSYQSILGVSIGVFVGL